MRIYNGTVCTMEGQWLENGYIDFDGGKITAIGQHMAGESHSGEGLDACGGYILPGFVDAHSHIGISEEGHGWQGEDCNETTDPVTPQLRASDGIYPFDTAIPKAVAAGVTSALVSPGSTNVIGGQICAIKLRGSTVSQMLLDPCCAMKFAMGENPKNYFGEKSGRQPMTRMAIASILREAFTQAMRYGEKKRRGDDVYDQRHEALLPVLEGKIPAHFHVHRSDDIMAALELCREFAIKCVLIHATDARAVADSVAAAGVYTILGPCFGPLGKLETRHKSFSTPGVLTRLGVKCAITTDHPVDALEYLSVMAAMAVRHGLDEESALRAITIIPAEIGGLTSRIGSLAPGKDADIAVFSGHPLDFRTTASAVFIDGVRMK